MTTRLATATPDAPAAPEPVGTGAALALLLVGIFVTTLDVFIVNVAIPSIQSDLHAGSATVEWVVAGFGLALAACLITGGRLGDLYGRRRLYGIGLGLFTIASLACGLATSPDVLVGARVIQGMSAALLMPQVLGIINVLFTGPRRTRAFVAYGLTMGLGGVFGQLIGGALIHADIFGLQWRSIFLINVPIGVIALALLRRVVPETRGARSSGLDLAGAALVAVAASAVVLPLVEGRALHWPVWTWICLAAAPFCAAGWSLWQRRVAERGGAPLVHPDLFRVRSFSIGCVIALVYTLAMASFFLILALYLQQGRGMDALSSGVLFMALGGGYLVASLCAARVAALLGRQVLAVGALVQFAGCAWLAVYAHLAGSGGGFAELIPGLVLAGTGMGLVLTPMADFVLAEVTSERAASAAGMLSTAQQIGGAIGVAVVGIVFYGVDGAVAERFSDALLPILGFCAAVAALTQLLGRKTKAADNGDAADRAEPGASVSLAGSSR